MSWPVANICPGTRAFEGLYNIALQQTSGAFQIHPEFHTLTWANGADFAPEFLHDNVRVTA